ncbi:MAG: GNAT family protein [Bacteroidota bacterium]
MSLRIRSRDSVTSLLDADKATHSTYWNTSNQQLLQKELDRLQDRYFDPNRNLMVWELRLQGAQQVIGEAGFIHWWPDQQRAEIGYRLWPAFRKQGFMQEALAPIIEYGFQEMQLRQIDAYVAPDNRASIQLLEGFDFQWIAFEPKSYWFEGAYRDVNTYVLSRQEH